MLKEYYKISLAEKKVLYIYNNSKKAFACKLDNMVETGKSWSSLPYLWLNNIVEPFYAYIMYIRYIRRIRPVELILCSFAVIKSVTFKYRWVCFA